MQHIGDQQISSDNPLTLRFNFDHWKSLHENDPALFEIKRKIFLEQILATTSRRNRRRLQGIIFQVEAIRQRATNPMKSCVDISQMMWDCFAQLNELLNDFDNACGHKQPAQSANPVSATILPFHPRR